MQRLKYMYQPQLRVILYGDVRVMNALTDVLAKDETGSVIIFAQASLVMSRHAHFVSEWTGSTI